MLIEVLGCSGGEAKGCYLTTFLIDGRISLDAGSLTSSLTFEQQKKVDLILVTHSHLDHIKSIPFMADNLLLNGNSKEIVVATTEKILSEIKAHITNNVIWPDFSLIPKDKPVLKFLPIQPLIWQRLFDLEIYPIYVNHASEALGYILKKDKNCLVFTGDTGQTDLIWKKTKEIKEIKAVIVECSFPNRMENIARVSKHLTPSLLFQELCKLKRDDIPIYVYHLKPNYREEIEKELEFIKEFKIYPLKRGDTIKI